MDMMRCPKCGRDISASSRACPECYHFLGAAEAAQVCWPCRTFWIVATVVAFVAVIALRLL